MAYLSVSIVFMIGLSTAWSYSITTEKMVITREAGEEVELKCAVEGSDWNLVSNPITWYKIQGDEETQMLNLGSQYEPFKGDRFPVPQLDDPITSIKSINPKILNLRAEDSGHYKCTVGSQSITHHLWVSEPIESLTLWGYADLNMPRKMEDMTEDEHLMYEADKEGFVECRAVGGIPPPTLRLIDSSNGRAVDGVETEHQVNMTGDVKGMRMMHYVTTVQHDEFALEQKSDGHKLKCEATVGDEVETTERTISLTYMPFIEEGDCEKVHYAPLGRDRKITCMFYSKPAPSRAYWANRATGENTEVEIEQVEDFKYAIHLKLPDVSASDFTQYDLRVENTVGNLQYEIEVQKGDVEIEEGEVGDGNAASSVWPHYLLVLLTLTLSCLQRS